MALRKSQWMIKRKVVISICNIVGADVTLTRDICVDPKHLVLEVLFFCRNKLDNKNFEFPYRICPSIFPTCIAVWFLKH